MSKTPVKDKPETSSATQKPRKLVKGGKFKPFSAPKTVWKCKNCGRKYLNAVVLTNE